MYMVRVGEIFLKGKNRNLFFNQLYANLKEHNIKIIKKFQSKFLVEDTENLKFIFGISNYSKVIECTHEELKDKALNLIKDHKTFCVRVKRTDKVLKPSPELEREIIQYLIKENTLTVYETEGDWDIAIGFLVKELKEFNQILNKFQKKYKKFINKKETALMINYIHHPRKYLIENPPKNYNPLLTGSSKKENTDEQDNKILSMITGNAKLSLLKISQKLNLTPVAIRYRINQLEKKKIILTYKALIDYNKLGYQYYKIDLDIENPDSLKSLMEYSIQHPNIIYVDITFGGSDFEFDIEVKNHKEFQKIIQDIKTKFPGLIRTYKYYKATKIHKYSYLPEIQS